tara:strand:+ start:226 stop:366 length:141 start_codon:yes stop_codon:yes gene_type:complete
LQNSFKKYLFDLTLNLTEIINATIQGNITVKPLIKIEKEIMKNGRT